MGRGVHERTVVARGGSAARGMKLQLKAAPLDFARRQASVIKGKRGFVFVGTVRSRRQKLSYELQKRITVARRRTECVKHR